MKRMVWLAGFILIFAASGIAQGQGIRGFAGSGRASGASGASGTVLVPPRSNVPAITQSSPRSGQNSIPSRAIAPGNPQIAPGRFHRGGGIFMPPVNGPRRPRLVLGVAPHRLHFPWFFHHPPSVLFVDVPPYDSTIMTQYAPGNVQQEPLIADDSRTDVRTRTRGQLAPFDPTPNEVVERMLALARLKNSDVVYDLGSGDGRVVIAAAKKYGVHAVGLEIDPGLAKLARENVRRAGVEKLVEIRQQDFLTADLSPASVVTLYLSYDGNLALRPQLLRQLKRGARVISYTFDMGDWQPKIAESFHDSEGNSHQIYLWQVGEPVLFSDAGPQILQPQPLRRGPLIIDVK
jgi:SAM-dependent methyltransferase